ncbi:MAG: ImmA/IrrE family metallo-endopeptidase [Planctomycetota bacterium]|nr:ImmA/IrrE family metallo-endopeptidase [Planctomycetota bacterium]MDA1139609.1 ImmA/IrrE family metallo-endopeptidase [Planctomycetota bacterium]
METLKRDIDYIEDDEIEPTNLTKKEVENVGQSIGEIAKFTPGDDPRSLIEAFKGRLHVLPVEDSWWRSESGSIFVHSRGDFDVVLPRTTSPLRDNFTIAHEIGHYVLHSDCGDKSIIAYRRGSTRIEWEANWFAAGLLMPEEAFRAAMREKGRDNLRALAHRFNVSVVAAEVRRDTVEPR